MLNSIYQANKYSTTWKNKWNIISFCTFCAMLEHRPFTTEKRGTFTSKIFLNNVSKFINATNFLNNFWLQITICKCICSPRVEASDTILVPHMLNCKLIYSIGSIPLLLSLINTIKITPPVEEIGKAEYTGTMIFKWNVS